jgi:putative phage-type endonuclease
MMPQRSDEWYAIRRGKITASEVGPFALKSEKSLTKAAAGARAKVYAEKVAELFGCQQEPRFESYAMKRGTELEPVARVMYETITGNTVEEVGFVEMEGCRVGCSPDGFIDNRKGMVEIKCPLPKTHIRYVDDGVLPPEYEMQLHDQMAVCEARYVDFFSFCPGLPYFLIRVERDGTTRQMVAGLREMSEELDAMIERFVAIFEQQKEELAKL